MLRPKSVAVLWIPLLSILALFGQLYGQRFGRRFGFNQNEAPETEFVFARWAYSAGFGGWEHDYPDAEEHINQVMKEATGINVDVDSYQIVPISSKEIFNYPFGYISEPGMMRLTDAEVKNFREFVDRGGFVMLDDFDGPYQFRVMQENMRRVFPDREMYMMTDANPILHTYYDIDSLYVE